MNPNDLSIPELENLLARKDEYRNGMDFWDKLTEEEQKLIENAFKKKIEAFHNTSPFDFDMSILCIMNNYCTNDYLRPFEMEFFLKEKESMKLLYLKIVSDFNLFLGFQRYINYRLFLLLKEVK